VKIYPAVDLRNSRSRVLAAALWNAGNRPDFGDG
jgi:hypothetical protein